jgi:hypothetical protein
MIPRPLVKSASRVSYEIRLIAFNLAFGRVALDYVCYVNFRATVRKFT